jgi:hypothetical protein
VHALIVLVTTVHLKNSAAATWRLCAHLVQRPKWPYAPFFTDWGLGSGCIKEFFPEHLTSSSSVTQQSCLYMVAFGMDTLAQEERRLLLDRSFGSQSYSATANAIWTMQRACERKDGAF